MTEAELLARWDKYHAAAQQAHWAELDRQREAKLKAQQQQAAEKAAREVYMREVVEPMRAAEKEFRKQQIIEHVRTRWGGDFAAWERSEYSYSF